MNKIVCVTLLIAVSLEAQNVPVAQNTAPPKTDSATQASVQEHPLGKEIVKQLLELGYVNTWKPQKSKITTVTSARCAVPLISIPVTDKERFKINTAPANPSIDPKIVTAPLLPACPASFAPPAITPPKASKSKK